MAGAVLHCLNLRLDARTISVILHHAQSKLVFVDCQSESVIIEAISLFPPDSERPLLVFIEDDDVQSTPSLKTEFFATYEAMMLNGAVHSHRGTFLVALDSLIEWSVLKEAVLLWTLPMFHANGWSYTWSMVAAGGINVCLRKFDVSTVYAAIRKHHVTHMCGAPMVLNLLCNVPDGKPLEKPVCILTAGALPPEAVPLGFIVSQAYGLTEMGEELTRFF
ncbi:hypothetical protein ACS0TY_027691 [Phlomoides rotata]